jgi:uncharacterized membrane protein
MSTHTLGPWTVYENSPDSDALPSVMAKQPNGTGLFYVAQANRIEDARLIAAAPELRAELERAANTFRDFAVANRALLRNVMAEAAEIAEASARALLARIDYLDRGLDQC